MIDVITFREFLFSGKISSPDLAEFVGTCQRMLSCVHKRSADGILDTFKSSLGPLLI